MLCDQIAGAQPSPSLPCTEEELMLITLSLFASVFVRNKKRPVPKVLSYNLFYKFIKVPSICHKEKCTHLTDVVVCGPDVQ